MDMALWAIGWNDAIDLDLTGCDVVTLFQVAGFNHALIECDVAVAGQLENFPGVTSVVRAREGETYVDEARSGATVIVEGDGTKWRVL
jgi:hypothetical protein